MNIKEFISESIIIDRFPVSTEIKKNGKHECIDVVINVSDEFYLGSSEEIFNQGKLNYYFPLGEELITNGLTSIYGALQILHSIYIFKPEWKILLHCQAGLNRSPMIKSAFYYMMTGDHEPIDDNRLLYNCAKGYLPPKDKMELFLNNCKFTFDNPNMFLGGMFDWVISESKFFE